MEPIVAIVTGILFACGFYALLQGHLFRIIVGFVLISNAVNLLIFTSGRLSRQGPPIIEKGQQTAPLDVGNPLAGALILTSIVITFGLLSFLIMLVYRTHKQLRTLTPLPGAEEIEEREPQ